MCVFFILTRPKCSVSSVVFVHEPCGRTDVSHGGGPDHPDTVKVEEHQNVEFKDSNTSRRSNKNESSPGSAPQFPSKGDQWICSTYSNRSKHKSVPCKQTCKSTPLTFCAQKVEPVQILQVKSETSSSKGEIQPSFPSRDAELNHMDQIPHKDTNVSTAYLQSTNTASEVSANSVIVPGLGHEDPKTDEALHESNTFSKTGDNFSEKEGESLYTPNFCTGGKIQRRVRIYKYKRRKIDANMSHSESDGAPDNSLLKLWKLFQSSDDMDVEFHGFTD